VRTKKEPIFSGPLVVSLVVVAVFALAASKPNFARCGQRAFLLHRFWSLLSAVGVLRKKSGGEWRYQLERGAKA
jgi:hypothetical protein